jgi:hypothetical protein
LSLSKQNKKILEPEPGLVLITLSTWYSERIKKERVVAAAAKLIQGESSTSVSTLIPERCSPRKLYCPQIQKLFELFGHSKMRIADLEGCELLTLLIFNRGVQANMLDVEL